jgi:hypothetical protein
MQCSIAAIIGHCEPRIGMLQCSTIGHDQELP